MDHDAIIVYSLIPNGMVQYFDDFPCIEAHSDDDADDADVTEYIRYGFGKYQRNQRDDQVGYQGHPLDKVFDGIPAEKQLFLQIERNGSHSGKQRFVVS